jgi:hypothetical protein
LKKRKGGVNGRKDNEIITVYRITEGIGVGDGEADRGRDELSCSSALVALAIKLRSNHINTSAVPLVEKERKRIEGEIRRGERKKKIMRKSQ